jgi:curved DNA-binding protein CbpA
VEKGKKDMAQTDGFRDLYRIMQVHHLAEPEVIEGAYKRLSKKYHPDANRDSGSEEKMKLINHAYSILSHPEKRREYDLVFNRRQAAGEPNGFRPTRKGEDILVESAACVVEQYFAALAKRDFERAYDLISDEDRNHIGKKEFWEWQEAVAALYEIGEYRCAHFKTVSGKDAGYHGFACVVEFQVRLVERERATGALHPIEFSRMVVRERNELRLYLGHKDVQAVIARMRRLAAEQLHPEENGYDKPAIHREIEREMARTVRYSRPFSLLLLEAVNFRQTEADFNPDRFEAAFTAVLREVRKNLRVTDYGGRLSRNRIMIVLPETRIFAAVKAAEKIFRVIRTAGDPEGSADPAGQLIFCAGVAQYKQGSLQEYLDLAAANVLAARHKGEWRIVF